MARIGRFTGMASGPYGASLSTVQPVDSIFPKQPPDPGSTSDGKSKTNMFTGQPLTPDEMQAGFYRHPEGPKNGSDLVSTDTTKNDSEGYYILEAQPRTTPILGNDTYRK